MIKPQEINEDGLPVLNWKENEDGLPVMGQPQKKKDGGNWYDNGGTNGNGVGRLGGSVQKNSIGSAAINKVQIESPSEYISKFEEKTGYKPLSLGSNLPQIAKRREEKKYLQYQSIDENEINPVKLGVASGTISPKELKALYEKPYGKKVVADIINSELPGLEINDLEPNAMRPNEDKFGEIAKELQVKNRQQGIDAQNQSEFNLDNELSTTLSGSTYGADRVGVRGGGEAFAERKENDFGNINTSSASELADALRKIGGSTKVWDAEGKEINKKELSKKINNRIFQLKAGEDIHPEIAQESELISSVVDAMPVEYKRQGGSANNERDAEYIMSGLNFIRDTRPGEYKAIMSTMKVTGKMPETTYTELANIGRDVKFYKDFKSGKYVEQDDRSFITPQLKKANLAGWLSEDLARKGFRNRSAFTQKEILESYKNAPDELKDDELVADIIKAERAPSFGFIPIPQGEGIAKKGVLNSAMRGMATPIGDILNSVDVGFTASYKSPFDAYLKSKELDRGNQTIINKKGDFTKTLDDNFWNKGVEGFFNLMTQAAIARGIGNVTKLPLNAAIGRIDPRAAITANQAALSIGTPLSTMAQTFGGEYIDFLEKTGSPTKATFGALVSGLAQGQIERFVMPDVKLVDDLNLLTTRRNFAKEIINVIDNGGGRKGVADVVKDYIGNVTKIIGKEAWLEEGAQNFTNYLTEQIISPQTAQDRDLLKETIDTGLAATAQMGLFSLFGAAGQTKMQQRLGKAQLKSIAINSEQFINALGNQLAKGEISQPDYDLSVQIINKHRENNLNAPKRDANGELISAERQLEYAYQSTIADIAEQQASKISDKIQREPFEKKIAEADKIRRQIFYGEEVKGLPKEEEEVKPDPNSIESLLPKLRENSSNESKGGDIQYFINKAAEDPAHFMDVHGKKVTNQLLEEVPTEKLVENRDFLVENFGESESTDFLSQIIKQREQPSIDQVREMADENTPEEVVSESVAGSGGVGGDVGVLKDVNGNVMGKGESKIIDVSPDGKQVKVDNVNGWHPIELFEVDRVKSTSNKLENLSEKDFDKLTPSQKVALYKEHGITKEDGSPITEKDIENSPLQYSYDFMAYSDSGKWNSANSELESLVKDHRKAYSLYKMLIGDNFAGDNNTFKDIVDYINNKTDANIEYTDRMRRADETMSAEERQAAVDSYNKSAEGKTEDKVQKEKDILEEHGLADETEYSPHELVEKFPLKGVQKVIWDIISPIVKKLGIKVKFSSSRITEGFDGSSNPMNGEVLLRPSTLKNGRLGEVLVHEVVHSLTTKIISRVNSGVETGLTSKQVAAVKGLGKLYKSIEADNNLQNKYPVKDIFEFIAHLTNDTFVKELQSKDRNFIQKVVDFISDILGLSDANELAKKYLKDIIHDGTFLEKEGITVVSSDYAANVKGAEGLTPKQRLLEAIKNNSKTTAEKYHDLKSKGKENDFTKAVEQSQSKQESGGKAPVTKPEGKSDDVVDKVFDVGGDVDVEKIDNILDKYGFERDSGRIGFSAGAFNDISKELGIKYSDLTPTGKAMLRGDMIEHYMGRGSMRNGDYYSRIGRNEKSVPESFTAKGGNKVVDEKGEPITVYHGTDNIQDIMANGFDPNKRGETSQFGDERPYLYFSSEEGNANFYAKGEYLPTIKEDAIKSASDRILKLDFKDESERDAARDIVKLIKKETPLEAVSDRLNKYKKIGDISESKVKDILSIYEKELNNIKSADNTKSNKPKNSGIVKSNISMKNPLIIDNADGKYNFYSKVMWGDLIDRMESGGYDGLIIKNTKDPFKGDVYIIDDPTRIKATEYIDKEGNKVEQSLKETTKEETTTQEGNAEKVAEGGKSISDVDLEKQFFHNSAMSLATKGKEKESYQEKAAELYEKVKDNEGLSEREMEFLKKNIYNDPTKTRDENLEKYANKNENTTTQSEGKVAELEAARDMAILREKVPEMGNVNEVVPTREAVSAGSSADNLTVNKRKRAELKNRYTELQKLLGCLMK